MSVTKAPTMTSRRKENLLAHPKLIIIAIIPFSIYLLVAFKNRSGNVPLLSSSLLEKIKYFSSSPPTSNDVVVLQQILSEDLQKLDPSLPSIIQELKRRGAHRCWHKHSTFLQHLVGVHNILRLWGQSRVVGRVGLLHSAYSNSYVNLALFDPQRERHTMQSLVGRDAEELIYTFCIIDRQHVVVNTLTKRMQIPPMGMTVPHLREENTTVYLSPDFLQKLVIFTMADIADQYFGWQDILFDGKMLSPPLSDEDNSSSSHHPSALWPGISKPGLWMNFVSKLCAVAATHHSDTPLPPVFENCTAVVTEEHEVQARDLYWKVIVDGSTTSDTLARTSSEEDSIISTLKKCINLNPYIFEPLVLLAQSYLHINDFSNAVLAAENAMRLQEMWGTAWDKRLGFPAWVAWTKVLHQRAVQKQPWPTNSWEVNNFGLVK